MNQSGSVGPPMNNSGKDLQGIIASLNELAEKLRRGVHPAERVSTLKKFRLLLKLADEQIEKEAPHRTKARDSEGV